MCCKDERECCDKKYNFELLVNGKAWPTKEEEGKQFAEWIICNVGGNFYKGFVENLKFYALRYDLEKGL